MEKVKGKNYSQVCWSCGKETMEPRGNYFKCSNCGATWNALPRPSVHGLENTWVDSVGKRHWHPIGIAD